MTASSPQPQFALEYEGHLATRMAPYFWKYVDVTSDKECWNWKCENLGGRPSFSFLYQPLGTAGVAVPAQIFAYESHVGSKIPSFPDIPNKPRQHRLLTASCANDLCCNPLHLRVLSDEAQLEYDAISARAWRLRKGGQADHPVTPDEQDYINRNYCQDSRYGLSGKLLQNILCISEQRILKSLHIAYKLQVKQCGDEFRERQFRIDYRFVKKKERVHDGLPNSYRVVTVKQYFKGSDILVGFKPTPKQEAEIEASRQYRPPEHPLYPWFIDRYMNSLKLGYQEDKPKLI